VAGSNQYQIRDVFSYTTSLLSKTRPANATRVANVGFESLELGF
jgi:hypothetical protein